MATAMRAPHVGATTTRKIPAGPATRNETLWIQPRARGRDTPSASVGAR